ncbi:MAG: hypothetical protein R6U67_07505 [Sodalinema sp.]
MLFCVDGDRHPGVTLSSSRFHQSKTHSPQTLVSFNLNVQRRRIYD